MRTNISMLMSALVLVGCGGDGGGGAMNPVSVTPSSSSSGGGVTPSGSPPAAVSQALSAKTPVDPGIVTADNGFGLTLFQNLLSADLAQTPNGNLAISPLSVAMALQIVDNGANTAGMQAMGQTLQLGSMDISTLNTDNAALQASLISTDPQVQVTVANSLWVHMNSTAVSSSFVQTDENFYGAEVGDLSGAPANVNAWVSQQTQGLITTIAPPSLDYNDMVALIANAVYFKGAWTSAFDPNQTASAAFTRGDGTQVMVPFMHQTESVPYTQGSNYQAVSLPYGQGGYSMLIVLPATGVDLGTFAAGLTGQSLQTMMSQMQPGKGTLSLPRFSTSYAQDLSPTLGSMGMTPVFCPSAALIDIGDSCVSFVRHATVVEVDESGTVAAGATAIGIGVTAVGQSPPPFTMTMNVPFLYAVVDNTDGEILFIGAMMDPSA